jgi:hypothetical protein
VELYTGATTARKWWKKPTWPIDDPALEKALERHYRSG